MENLINKLEELEFYPDTITAEEFLGLNDYKKNGLDRFSSFVNLYDTFDENQIRDLSNFLSTMYNAGEIDGFPRKMNYEDLLIVKLHSFGATRNLEVTLPSEICVNILIRELMHTKREIYFDFEDLESTIELYRPLIQ